MISASSTTLMKLWLSQPNITEHSANKRIQAILTLEDAVVKALPAHMKRPNDIIQLAIERAKYAKSIFGDITFLNMTELHPVWRTLISELSKYVRIEWETGARELSPWIEASPDISSIIRSKPTSPQITSIVCATARHEVIESVRWARKLMSEGVAAQDIAIASVSTSAYDDHMVSVTNETDIDIHFPHGISAIHRVDGQACCALTDILLRGLSQKRVRRFVHLLQALGSAAVDGLPANWGDAFKPDAALTELSRWQKILSSKPETAEIKTVLLPVLQMLAKGSSFAAEAGEFFLTDIAKKIWQSALLEGPADALDRTIPMQRIDDGADANTSACFMSAENLAASPRRFVRLIGLTSRDWPRQVAEDALIPDYIIPSYVLDPMPCSEIDRRDYNTIKATTETVLVLSWARRDAEGRQLGVSRLITQIERDDAIEVQRTATPAHALSDSDRLFAREKEYVQLERSKSALLCWNNWRKADLTAHDGLISLSHPRIEAVFKQPQSATSIKLLLRDPIGYVWKYALGFNAPEYEDNPLFADPREFGNIVHDILKQTARRLNAKGGLTTTDREIISRTIDEQSQYVGMRTEMTKPVPPTLIWYGMMQRATEFSKAALFADIENYSDQQTHVEVPFGGRVELKEDNYPWDIRAEVKIPGTDLKLQGFIDRLDLSLQDNKARVIDYKTGKMQKGIDDVSIDGGSEIQRVIYGFIVKSLLGNGTDVEAGLLYPATGKFAVLQEPNETLETVANAIIIAQKSIRSGLAIPAIGTKSAYNDMRFALPANAAASYLLRKNSALLEAIGEAADVWELK